MNYLKRMALFVAVIVLSALPGESQFNYYDSMAAVKQPVFNEDFSFVKGDWSVGTFNNGCRVSSIEDNNFVIQSSCGGENPLFWTNMVFIDQNRNFEIETAIEFMSGEDNNANALIWGMVTGSFFRYRFGISGNGQFLIDKYTGGWNNIKSWTPSPLVLRNQHNKLTVRKIGYTYYFFLNQQLVHTAPFEPFFGQGVGFQGNQNTRIRVDYLRISYLQ